MYLCKETPFPPFTSNFSPYHTPHKNNLFSIFWSALKFKPSFLHPPPFNYNKMTPEGTFKQIVKVSLLIH